MSLEQLFQDVDTGSEELAQEELSNNTGSVFVKDNGIYKGTIARCFVTETKKGGVCLDLHIEGDTVYQTKIYPVSGKKDKKGNIVKMTTYTVKGKTQSLNDYKMLKQLVFVATGKGQELKDIKIEEQDMEFKEYGKDVSITAGVLTELVGKDIQFGVRCEEEYNYEDGETDKTAIKTDDDGNPRYKKSLFSVYSAEGKTALEVVKKEDATQLEKDKEFLLGDKGIKKVKLEVPEIEGLDDVEENEDSEEIDF